MLDKIIRFIVYSFLLILPVAINPKLNDPYDFNKATILYTLNCIIAILWLFKGLTKGTRFYKTGANFSMLLLLLIQLLSTIFSISPYISLYGHYLRYDGLLTWMNYIFLFFVVINFINTPKYIKKALICICFGAFLSGLYGIYQYLSVGSEFWGSEKSRSASTLGNPVFFAAYMVTSLFPAISLFLYEEKKKFLYLFGFLVIIIYLGLLSAQTRASFLGLFIVLPLFLILQAKYIFSKENIAKFMGLLSIICLITIPLAIHPKIAIFKRLGLTFEITKEKPLSQEKKEEEIIEEVGEEETKLRLAGTAKERIFLWRQFLNMALDRPIFGAGPDTTILLFSSYRSIETTESIGQYGRADRAHNELVDTCATRGFVGVFVYLFTLILLLKCWIFNYKAQKPKVKVLLVGILCGALAYFAQNQFQLGTVPGLSLFWTLLGLGVAKQYNKFIKIQPLTTKNKALSFFILLFVLIGVIFYLRLLFLHYKADIYFRIANICEKEPQHWDYAIVWYNRALNLWKRQDKYYESLINLYLKKALQVSGQRKIYFADKGLELAKFAVKELPYSSILWNLLGAAYEIRGYPKEAIEAFQRARELDPYFIDPTNNIAMVHVKSGKFDKAIEVLKEGLNIYKDCPRFIHSLGFIYNKQGELNKAEAMFKKVLNIAKDYDRLEEVYKSLASVYDKKKEYKKAIEVYRKMLLISPQDCRIYVSIGELYFKLNDLDNAIKEYKKAVELNPSDLAIHRDLGSIYLKKGMVKQAIEEFNLVLSKNPNDRYVISLLNSLGVKIE